jgi:hypothetical protein
VRRRSPPDTLTQIRSNGPGNLSPSTPVDGGSELETSRGHVSHEDLNFGDKVVHRIRGASWLPRQVARAGAVRLWTLKTVSPGARLAFWHAHFS